jgi:hypothetical protein
MERFELESKIAYLLNLFNLCACALKPLVPLH